ncbi:MAG TPA: tyrosine-protein phosphatase [Candidatus Dormibacteraeota bacterium]|nr:tyrosine-protein phosphatase [Candidatus Dormibacteraeota bacterium]
MRWPDCRNTRDLGGLPCGAGFTRPGAIVRSDNVSSLTTEGIQAMWEYGIRAVVDVRSEGEVAARPSPFAPADYGPLYLHVPLLDDPFADELSKVPSMLDRYRIILDERQQSIAQVVRTIARVDGPVLFHCFAGKDRTGLIAALVLSVAGVDNDSIAADFAATDEQMASRYAEWLATAPADRVDAMRDELRCPPEWMHSVLDHVGTRWGGAEPYLAAGGVQPLDFVALRAKLAG